MARLIRGLSNELNERSRQASMKSNHLLNARVCLLKPIGNHLGSVCVAKPSL